MNQTDLNLIPTIDLWRMANVGPDNHTLQTAVSSRDKEYRQMQNQNHLDREANAKRRAAIAGHWVEPYFNWVWPNGA